MSGTADPGPVAVKLPQDQAAVNDVRNKFEQAREELRDMLGNGTFAPNARLTEAKLADTLQISRGTLRSVFASLRNGDIAVTSTTRAGNATVEVARRQPDGTWLWMIDQPNVLG
jgi:DNA-binding FadR family transcriptional regulator